MNKLIIDKENVILEKITEYKDATEEDKQKIGNALSKLIKRNLLTTSEAILVLHEFYKIPIRLIEPDIANSVVIAAESNSYAYDAYYLNIANQLSEPLFNRFVHVYIKTTVEKWLKWASEKNIHIEENIPLVDLLDVQEVGDAVPEETWIALSKIFAFVLENSKKVGE